MVFKHLAAVSGITLLSLFQQGSTSKFESLLSPPKIEREQVACHSAAWESQQLTDIEGFRVHRRLTQPLNRLLSTARSSGINMQIRSAYRTCSEQQYLRSLNCLNSQTLVTSCTPPTEFPGKSLHNEGLAIDFACQGYSLFETSPCYTWLKNNGSTANLIQRPDEAWHWSTAGY